MFKKIVSVVCGLCPYFQEYKKLRKAVGEHLAVDQNNNSLYDIKQEELFIVFKESKPLPNEKD